MYSLETTTQFRKDYKSLQDSDIEKVDKALVILANEGTLPYTPYLTHKLTGQYADNMEAHIKPNLLIIWFEVKEETIRLVRVGSHSKLFKKKQK